MNGKNCMRVHIKFKDTHLIDNFSWSCPRSVYLYVPIMKRENLKKCIIRTLIEDLRQFLAHSLIFMRNT